MRSRRPERGEALKFKINVHRRLKTMAFVTDGLWSWPPVLLHAERLRWHRSRIRGFLFMHGVQYLWAGAPFDACGVTSRSL